MHFENDFIEKVRESSNIVDEISQFVEFKRSSSTQLKGLCPFPDHNEKTPSFSVSESKQVYYCFGCKKSGNIFKFLQVMKGLSFPEAIEYLADKASIDIPKESQQRVDPQSGHKKNKIEINNILREHFHENL